MEDLTYSGNEALMEEVHKENLQNQYTKEGVYVIHTLLGNWMEYGKKLLARFDEYEGFTPKTKQSQIGVNTHIPENEITIQNYPNPFNPSTQINYRIPSNSKVSVKIYDVFGRVVAVLVDNEFQNAGWHSTDWRAEKINGNPVSSGIYFCRILSNSQVRTIKLVLMK
jgi:flagellar hook assembly protein FlgD